MKMIIRKLLVSLFVGIISVQGAFGQSHKSIQKLQSEIAVVTERIEREKKAKEKVEEQLADLKKKVELSLEIQKSIAADLEFRREAQVNSRKLEAELRDRIVLLDAYENGFVSKSTLVSGQKLGDVTLKSGKKYKGVTFKRSEGAMIALAHSGGFATVELSDLPDELSGRFKLPPQRRGNKVNMETFLLSKPDEMKSSEQRLADYTTESENRERDLQKTSQERQEMNEVARAVRDTKRDEKKAEREIIEKKIHDLDAKYDQLGAAISAQMSAKSAIERERRSNKIYKRQTKSSADHNKIMTAYETKIGAMKSEQVKLKSEISALRSEMNSL